jgi:hypothetical protein
MRSGQGESRELLVIEPRPLPGIHRRMALLAGGWESERSMAGRRRLHVRIGVTANTIRRQTLEPSRCSLLVARFTIDSCVSAQQREAVLMIANLVDRTLPSVDSVATITLRAHFAAMNVGVAVAAFLADVTEYRF